MHGSVKSLSVRFLCKFSSAVLTTSIEAIGLDCISFNKVFALASREAKEFELGI